MQKPGQILEQIQRIAEEMQSKVGDAIRNSPAQEIEKNVRAMMNQGFQKMDLVTRDEFELQSKVLSKTREKLEALELKVAEMEKHRVQFYGLSAMMAAGKYFGDNKNQANATACANKKTPSATSNALAFDQPAAVTKSTK